MPHVNLLPWRERRRKQRQNAFYALLGLAALGAVLVVGTVDLFIGHLQSRQLARNELLTREIAILDKKIAEIRELKAQKAALLARMEIIRELQIMRPREVKLLDGLSRTLPDGAFLTSFTQRGTDVTLDGIAQSNARVSAFMHNLDASDRFGQSLLRIIRNNDRNGFRVSNFTLTVPQQIKAPEEDPDGTPQGAAP